LIAALSHEVFLAAIFVTVADVGRVPHAENTPVGRRRFSRLDERCFYKTQTDHRAATKLNRKHKEHEALGSLCFHLAVMQWACFYRFFFLALNLGGEQNQYYVNDLRLRSVNKKHIFDDGDILDGCVGFRKDAAVFQ
jgi:hypothetical protein